MSGNLKRFYDLTAKLLSGEPFNFSSLKGKVVLIENVASLWGTTVRDYTQMNELHSRYSAEGLVVLGVPCNQFGHQVRQLCLCIWYDHIRLRLSVLSVFEHFDDPLLKFKTWRRLQVLNYKGPAFTMSQGRIINKQSVLKYFCAAKLQWMVLYKSILVNYY